MVPEEQQPTQSEVVQEIEAQLLQSAHRNQTIEIKPEQASRIVSVLHSFHGPLPPPDLLQKYEKLVPGFAKILLQDIQEQNGLSRELQKTALLKEYRMRAAGQIFAFVVALVTIAATTYLGKINANLLIAIAVMTVGIGGPTVAALFADGIHIGLRQRSAPQKEDKDPKND
jgi:uncharacterized membrane protein